MNTPLRKLNLGLYGITDPAILPEEIMLSGVTSALSGGCRVLQYRDKTATDSQRLRTALTLATLCQRFGAQLIINDDLELALKCKADGVHLGKSDGDISYARKHLKPHMLLGVTCHNDINYAHEAILKGVDYCAFGRIFPSKTKPSAPPCSIETLSEAVRSLSKPVVAIGGITLDNMQVLMQTPLQHVAVIHGLFAQTDISQTACQFQHYFSHSHSSLNYE